MKFGWLSHKPPFGFSLHQSGTVMKSTVPAGEQFTSFSLHQSGTVMKYDLNSHLPNFVLVYIKAVR